MLSKSGLSNGVSQGDLSGLSTVAYAARGRWQLAKRSGPISGRPASSLVGTRRETIHRSRFIFPPLQVFRPRFRSVCTDQLVLEPGGSQQVHTAPAALRDEALVSPSTSPLSDRWRSRAERRDQRQYLPICQNEVSRGCANAARRTIRHPSPPPESILPPLWKQVYAPPERLKCFLATFYIEAEPMR